MISINLIRAGLPFVPDNGADQVLCKVRLGPHCAYNPTALPPSLHPRLMERLLGKSPLRLVLKRTELFKGCWQETLECGHEVTSFQEFAWDYESRLIPLEPIAKRRRCQKCKPPIEFVKTPAEIAAAQARAELIYKRKRQFGSLFEKLCFENGELRPGLSGNEFSVASVPSPRKPVQSVKPKRKEDAA